MTTLEEIARAICIAQGADPNMVLAINESYSGAPVADIARPLYRQPQFIEAARAAVEAMREPTDAMVLRGHEMVDDPRGGFVDVTNVIDGWKAMIDAILNEKP